MHKHTITLLLVKYNLLYENRVQDMKIDS